MAIAPALVTNPAITLPDEPIGELDAASPDESLAILSTLNKKYGETILMGPHDPRAQQPVYTSRNLDKGQMGAMPRAVVG